MPPWTAIELLAVIGNLAYTVLMAWERRSGWLFGIVASALSVALFLHQQLPGQVVLSAYYVAMGAYGWITWGKGMEQLPIRRRTLLFHVVLLGVVGLLTLMAGRGLERFLDSSHPYEDAFVTVLSLFATWMLARKVLENWVYWIIADAVGVHLYLTSGLTWYALLFVVYIGLSIAGLWRWWRSWRGVSV
ncbi:MAG: nicotinamide mononucleotide transporter [Flavobacteriales bacterium]|nr:nicotinamide mononucleotide transporter [Flavobacteriales bacterium]MCB9193371.1 nicotinamide mononucleotide transporter [Flavobacteriales bacterium]